MDENWVPPLNDYDITTHIESLESLNSLKNKIPYGEAQPLFMDFMMKILEVKKVEVIDKQLRDRMMKWYEKKLGTDFTRTHYHKIFRYYRDHNKSKISKKRSRDTMEDHIAPLQISLHIPIPCRLPNTKKTSFWEIINSNMEKCKQINQELDLSFFSKQPDNLLSTNLCDQSLVELSDNNHSLNVSQDQDQDQDSLFNLCNVSQDSIINLLN